MKHATPPCGSVALLLRSSLPCPMRFTLTTANATPLDTLRTLLAVCVHPVGSGTTSHPLAVRPDWRTVHPAGDPDVHLLQLLRVPRKSEDW